MAKIKSNRYGTYVEGHITIPIQAYITGVEEGEDIHDTDALRLLTIELHNVSSSNTGAEMMINSKIELH